MRQKAIVLLDDYWHPRKTIEPLLPLILPSESWNVRVIDDPNYLGALHMPPDLIVNFKDGIANTQIPTPNWYDEDLGFGISMMEKMGATFGYLAIHCGTANIPEEHPIFTRLLKGRFLNHPAQCPVTFTPMKEHPITNGVNAFTFTDEHYQMQMLQDEVTVLGTTTSEHGTQTGLWVNEAGNIRVCGVTPGHTTENLTHPEYVKLLRNAVDWCARRI